MVEHANNQHNPHNGNEANDIPLPPTTERLYRMIHQLQDQNRKLSAQMEAMNRENARWENEASSHQNNDDPIGDEKKNNT